MNPVSFLFLASLWLSSLPAKSQSVSIVKFGQLQQLVSQPNDTLYVINFWATWCAPCVEELPRFERAGLTYRSEKLKVLLVSMDAKADLKTRVLPFVRHRRIRSRVVLLDETDLNTWVDKLVPEWSGALPMTLVLNNRQRVRQFIGKPVKEGELESIINHYKR